MGRTPDPGYNLYTGGPQPNPESEDRNPKQTPMTKVQSPKQGIHTAV